MYGVIVEMVNGDNFQHYSRSKQDINKFIPGNFIVYTMVKTRDDSSDKVKNRLKSFKLPKMKKKKPLIHILDHIDMSDLLFIDIETVRIENTLKNNTPLFESWEYKRRKEGEKLHKDLKASFKDKAPLYAEFGKVVCISIGMLKAGEVYIHSYSCKSYLSLI